MQKIGLCSVHEWEPRVTKCLNIRLQTEFYMEEHDKIRLLIEEKEKKVQELLQEIIVLEHKLK